MCVCVCVCVYAYHCSMCIQFILFSLFNDTEFLDHSTSLQIQIIGPDVTPC